MKELFKFLGYTVLSCASLVILFFVLMWVHFHARVDASSAVEDVARKLHVSPDKLLVLNEPRVDCSVVICKYLDNRTNVLNSCSSVIPPEEELKRVPGSMKKEILSMWHREFARIEKKARHQFARYGISLDGPVERLYYINGGGEIVETKECVYVMYYINCM